MILKKCAYFLKKLVDSIDINKILELNRPDEGVIDTFYNMMLSSRILSETEDNYKIIYDYSNETNISPNITELYLNDIFSEYITWEQFRKFIDINNINLDDEKTKMIWCLILLKENISIEDIKKIEPAEYNFSIKYTPVIAKYWIYEVYKKEYISISEWVLVIQELMCIHHNKIQYTNKFIRHTNTNSKLTAAIKNFHGASELPKQIILNRLINRSLLMFGTKDLLEDKAKIDRYIMQLEKIIFSYKNIEDIKAAHSYIFFHANAIVTTEYEIYKTFAFFKNNISVRNSTAPINIIVNGYNIYLYKLIISILAKDKCYRIINDKDLLKLRKECKQYFTQFTTIPTNIDIEKITE